ncbi:MAG: transposase [Spirochaetaceae bacterium]|nr:MAG: transposase [Spirochaetaceae bacterium]
MAVMKELFGAYNNGELPADGGYIVSSFFDESSTYTKYEVTSYNNVKDIYSSEDGLTFQADGKKVFVLVEPSDYFRKHEEPTYRDAFHKIPYRFKEVELITSARQDRIMVGKEPVVTYGSFTVLKSQGNNFSYIFFETRDLLEAMESFFVKSLREDARVPRDAAQKAGQLIRDQLAGIQQQKGA